MTSTRSRTRAFISFFVLLSLFTAGMGVLTDIDAQAQPVRTNSTPTPTPTEETGPANAFQIEPTEATIDDFQANPTERPTEEPREEPVDDDVVTPTDTPDIGEPPIAQGIVRVIKRDCPIGIVGDATLSEYLQLCPQPHDGVEFVLNDSNSAQAGVTGNGVIEWTGVDPGVFNITETIPAGFGDPIVFCGYTESPGGGVQHPSRQEATNGVVTGTFPYDTFFEYVCYWMNVESRAGLDIPPVYIDPNTGGGTADLLVINRLCPAGAPQNEGLAWYIVNCTATVDGIPFSVMDGNGSSTRMTDGGEARWSNLPLGPFSVTTDLPAQFGDPVVFCGWTALYDGGVYEAFGRQEAPGGTVALEVTVPGAHHFCYYYNVKAGPDSFADPGQLENTLLARTWICPDGTLRNQADRDYYTTTCELAFDQITFTLSTANGDETKATAGGFVEWTGLPLGPYTLQEAIPSGYGAPVFFCGWYAEHGGYHYDAFPQLIIVAAAGVYDGEITIPNTDAFCDVFNIEGGIDDFQANPTAVPAIDDFQGNATAGVVRLVKRDCPRGVPTDASLVDYLQICSQPHDGVDFTLETSAGIDPGITAAGQVSWTGVPTGAYEIRETIPAGYVDPIVFCGYTESPGGGVQHPARQSAPGGVVTGTFPDNTIFEYVCYWMNIRSTAQVGFPGADDIAIAQDDANVFMLEKRVCPADIARDETLSYYFEMCADTVDGFTFTLTNEDGSSAKPIIGGEAAWPGVPGGVWTLEEASSIQFGEPIVWCGWTAFHSGIVYDGFAQPVDASGGSVGGEITVPNTTAFCFWMNVQATPGSITQPQDTTNALVARAWMCPANAERIANQNYLASVCTLASDPVEFTLSNPDGVSTQATSPGWTTWNDVPFGEFVLAESIPEGFADPIVFCGWTATYDGMIYDAFPHVVPAPDGVVEGNISVPNTSYTCDFHTFSTLHIIRVNSVACPAGANPTGHDWDGCSQLLPNVQYDLITGGGTTSGTTDALGHVMWSEVDLGNSGEIQIQEHTPEGLGDLTVWCGSAPEVAGDAQDFEYFQPTVSDGRITVQPEQHVPYTFGCAFFHIPGGTSFEIPGSFVNPTDESNTLVARTWFCPEDTPDDAHLLDFFDLCQQATPPVEFTLVNNDGQSTQTTVGGMIQWDDVPLGPFALQEHVPAGYEVLSIWCGFTAFYNGAVYDGFHQPVPFQDGRVEREIVVPNTDYACHFMNVPVSIDDFQANPTEAPEIDDLQQNPPATGTLIVHLWECPASYDPLAGDALVDCTVAMDGVTFGLFSHFDGPDYQAATGEETSGTVVFVPAPGTYSLIEDLPEGYEQPFLWNCAGLSMEELTSPISTINFFRIIIGSGQTIECNWMNVPSAVGFDTPGSALQA